MSRAEKRSIHLAGSPVEGSLGLDTNPRGEKQAGPYLDNNWNFIPAINTEALPIGGPPSPGSRIFILPGGP